MKEVLNKWNWKWMTILVFTIIFSTTILSQNTNGAWWNESFDYRKEINISSVSSEALTNFPIFINVSYESAMQTDFDDIRFMSNNCDNSSTSTLKFEKEYYDSNHAVFWVKIPTLETIGNSICMYYGNSTTSSTQSATNVWKSNYGFVYHMNSSGNDSTSNNRDRVSDVGSPTINNTYLGYGMYFDGNDAWSLQDLSYWEIEWFERSHEILFETSSDVTSRQTLFAEGGGTNGILMYILSGRIYVRWWSESTPNWGGGSFNTTISANSTYHAVMQLNETGDYGFYLNGNLIGNRSSPDHMDAHSGNGGIAYTGANNKDYHDGNSGPGNYFKGWIHEMRVYDSDESDDWINMSAQNMLNHSDTVSYGVEEPLLPNISISLTDPAESSLNFKQQNKTIDFNITISCNGKTGLSCGNVTTYLQRNNSASSFVDISTSSSTPLWTSSSQPQSCQLTAGNTCSFIWAINVTGDIGTQYLIRANTTTNYTNIENVTSGTATIQVQEGNAISFNTTTTSFIPFTKGTGNTTMNLSIKSDIGNNSNIRVSCKTGDCSKITHVWTDGTNLNETNNSIIGFTCSDSQSGTFSAIFNTTSDEYNGESLVNVTCEVEPIYGPISISINEPNPSITTNISHDKLFKFNATMNCSETCDTVGVYPVIDQRLGSGIDGNVTITTSNYIINNYTFLNGNENANEQIINVNDSSIFNIGDEILIIQIQNGSGTGEAGNYEFRRIKNISGNNLTLNINLTNSYGSGSFNTTSASATQVVRIPNFQYVNINSGSITAPAWDGFTGGIVAFRATNTITMSAYVDVSNKGFRGGDCNGCGDSDWGNQGEGYPGLGTGSLSANGNGGGGGYGPTGYNGEPGAGGGYGTAGSDGTSSFTSIGGNSIGDAQMSKIFFGGGAGGGGDDDNPAIKAQNVDGAGIALIFGKTIDNVKIHANGENGVGNGGSSGVTGGGAGGSVWIGAYNINISDITAIGGTGYVDSDDNGGDGGEGRIRIDRLNFSGATTPAPGYFYNMTRLPIWTNNITIQNCNPSTDGDCDFSWMINASGDIDSEHNITIITKSSRSSISNALSEIATIKIINLIPIITIIFPLEGYSVMEKDSTTFSWNITDLDDQELTCSIYINNTFRLNTTCHNNTINSINFNLTTQDKNWSLFVIDSRYGNSTSNTINFTVIENQHKRISKIISSQSTDAYLANINVENVLNKSEDIIVTDFINQNFSVGVVVPLQDFINITNGPNYFGNIYGWNLTVLPLSTNEINVTIGRNGPSEDFFLAKAFTLGLD